MEKELKAYRAMLSEELETLARLPQPEQEARVRRLVRWHRQKLAGFQHERLIHLMITLFFAFLLLTFFGLALFSGALFPAGLDTAAPVYLLFLLLLIILIVEIFYIRHYFILENGIQQLYLLENRLYAYLLKQD
jgi:hypothetical protein